MAQRSQRRVRIFRHIRHLKRQLCSDARSTERQDICLLAKAFYKQFQKEPSRRLRQNENRF